jgi:hypothetical protein
MTIAIDARFLLGGSVHPHSRLAHILLRRNRRDPYAVRFVLCTDSPPNPVVYQRDYAAANVVIEVFGPTGSRLAIDVEATERRCVLFFLLFPAGAVSGCAPR